MQGQGGSQRETRRPSLGAWLLILAPLVILVGPPLVTGRVFSFRDASHYYYPQFSWESRLFRAGEVPLWNPQDELGVSVAADPTASLFYPGKLILHLPFPQSFDLRFNLYVILHMALAAFMAYGLARAWRLRPAAAALVALSYAYGGNVLFLTSNVVYLVGAAWLPAAFWAIEGIVRRGYRTAVLGLATTLAMMILGGDPQGALHVVLVGLLRVWFRESSAVAPLAVAAAATLDAPLPSPARSCPSLANSSADVPASLPPDRRRAALLVCAASAMALALSAVQSLPSWRASRDSLRAAYDSPRSLPELAATIVAADPEPAADSGHAFRGIVGTPAAGTHHRQLYDFSVGPWRLLELLVPNGFGKMFPFHARWGFAIPAEGRIWTPTLFQGLVPIAFVIVGWLTRRTALSEATDRWLRWTATLAIAAGCGGYGFGWLVRELAGDLQLAAPDWLGDPVGGLYWLLVTCVPSYVQFRYPAKWWTVAALALACLAGRAFERWSRAASREAEAEDVGAPIRKANVTRVTTESNPVETGDAASRYDSEKLLTAVGRVAIAFLSLFATLALALVVLRATGVWKSQLATMPADEWLGPFDSQRAFQDTLFGVMLGASVAATLAGAARVARRSSAAHLRRRLDWLLVAVACVELVAANGWLVVTAPGIAWEEARPVAEQIGDHRFVRSRSAGGLPPEWLATSSAERLTDTVRWDARTLFSKLHLLGDARSIDSPVATASLDYALLLEVARSEAQRRTKHHGDDRSLAQPTVEDTSGAHARSPARLPSELVELWGVVATMDDVARLPGSMEEANEHVAGQTVPRDLPATPLRLKSFEPTRARLIRQVEVMPELLSRTPRDVRRRTREVLFPTDRVRDWRREAVVETSSSETFAELAGGVAAASTNGSDVGDATSEATSDNDDYLRIVEDRASCVRIDVALPSPALLVLADRYDPEWQVEVRDERGEPLTDARIVRANRVLRGVYLPAGAWTVDFVHRPAWAYTGLAISTFSALAAFAWLAREIRGRA